MVCCYHSLCSGGEDIVGHKVAQVVDKVKVWGQIWTLLGERASAMLPVCPGCRFLVLIAPAAWRKVHSEQLHRSPSVPWAPPASTSPALAGAAAAAGVGLVEHGESLSFVSEQGRLMGHARMYDF